MCRILMPLGLLIVVAAQAGATVWEWDCSVDPTTLDPAWGTTTGEPFNGNISEGLYHGGQQIRTSPTDFFNTPTVTVDVIWMASAASGSEWDCHIWLPIDTQVVDVWDEVNEEWVPQWTISPVFFFLTNDGTSQTLRIDDVQTWWAPTVIDTITDLPNDFIEMNIVFDTTADTFTVTIDGLEHGPYNYVVLDPPPGQGTDNVFAIAGEGPSELDYVRVETIAPPVWEWDCSEDPTALDFNGDAIMDWTVREGDPFNAGSLTDGIWSGGQTLDTRPLDDFATPLITADLRWRATASGPWQAVFWMNVEYAVDPDDEIEKFSPLYVFLENLGESQTLTLYNVFKSWETATLATITDLPADFIDLHMEVDTEADTVSLKINGAARGTYSYTWWGPANADKWATVLGGGIELDSIRIELGEKPEVKTWPIPGDANLDCKVNILDLIFVRNLLNQDPTSGNNWQANVNGDERINILDLIFVRNVLNTKCEE